MKIRDLLLVHRLKSCPHDSVRLRSAHFFYLDTCQRQLWLADASEFFAGLHCYPDLYRGEEAYEKLLLIACGIESRMLGETEVFGQLRSAWRSQPQQPRLDGLMQQLFEDTKFVRTEYLHGLGGQSYGTAVRKLIHPGDQDTILFVGAGELAASMIPMFRSWPMQLMNRTSSRAEALANRCRSSGCRIDVCKSPESLQTAPYVIICRPFDPVMDQQLGTLRGLRTLIHLGANSDQLEQLDLHAEVLGLDDIFAQQVADDKARLDQAGHARRVCRERARLRSLGSSVSLPHGWEDLPAFG